MSHDGTIPSCPDGSGSINNPDNYPPGTFPPEPPVVPVPPTPTPTPPPPPFVPPDLCIGDFSLTDECALIDTGIQEGFAAEALEIAGTQINIFKLLGIHEQGSLIDLTGLGYAVSGGSQAGFDAANAFDDSGLSWRSSQVGAAVTTTPAYIGYFLGTKKTSFGAEKYAPPQPVFGHITTIKIQQGATRALQMRVDRSDGKVSADAPTFVGTGNGVLTINEVGTHATDETILAVALTPTTFDVMSNIAGPLGVATVGQKFSSLHIKFTITAGVVPFIAGDTFTIRLKLCWYRVDVVNLPNTAVLETINIKQSAPSPYWRLVPLLFAGAVADPWEVVEIQLIDYAATTLDNVQDIFLQENRDRDYAKLSSPLKAYYQPFDAVSDLSKFGLNILDQYTFTVSFAMMIQQLGRPIVTGDILEVPPELQYDQNMRPVRKFLEVIDTGWSAEGFSPQWKPILYRFQANVALPSQETRDIIGTHDTQKYGISDGTFFAGIKQVNTAALDASENIANVARDKAPEAGSDPQEIASGASNKNSPRYALTNTPARRSGVGNGTVVFGVELGAVTFGSTNFGNGALTARSISSVPVSSETWALIATSASTFSVIGSISGAQAPAVVGSPYSNGIVNFTITNGAIPWIKADVIGVMPMTATFTFAGILTAQFTPGKKFQLVNSTGNNGVYTVLSSTAGINTDVTVLEFIPSAVADGIVRDEISFAVNRTQIVIPSEEQQTVNIRFTSATGFTVDATKSGTLGAGTVGVPFISNVLNFTVIAGVIPFTSSDLITIDLVNAAKPTYDGRDQKIEDGLPPDGIAYGEGFTLPPVLSAADGDYFRLNYPASTKIPPRLYKFSAIKGKWIYVETDRRFERSSHKLGAQRILQSPTSKPLSSDL